MSHIGLARKQRVFAALESTRGTLEFPTAADFIRPAGNATMNQVPSFAESEELTDSLDAFDTFQNATPAGDWSVPMYCRPSGTVGGVPQGDALFQSFQGNKNAATSGSLASVGGIDADDDTLDVDGLTGGSWPERGVIQIDSELIYYNAKSGSSTLTLSGLTRGYGGTTAATHSEDATVDLKSVFYDQDTTSPSFSLWIETDHFVQGMAGCTVTSLGLGVNNEGAVTLNFSGQGMTMVWAGTTELDANSAAAQKTVTLPSGKAKNYKAGAYVYFEAADGTEHTNSGDGYEVTEVDYTNDTLTVGTNLEAELASGDDVKGFLPSASVIGSPVESRNSAIEVDGTDARFRTTDWTFNVPKQFLTDEIGTEYPEDYLEDRRDITSTIGMYFRKDDARYFYNGYQGNEVPMEMTFGNEAGSKMAIYMKRCKLEVPAIEMEAPAVVINMGVRVLGTNGEDSVEIRFE